MFRDCLVEALPDRTPEVIEAFRVSSGRQQREEFTLKVNRSASDDEIARLARQHFQEEGWIEADQEAGLIRFTRGDGADQQQLSVVYSNLTGSAGNRYLLVTVVTL